MSQIQRSALVHYSAAEMYDLVNDVEAYPAFLPWCKSAKILSQTEIDMTANVEIARGILNKTFTTHNRLDKHQKIDIELVDGPFRQLQGYWKFDALKTENACKVSLQLDFEFNNAMMSIAAGPIFTQIANSLVDAFSKRAEEVYGVRV